MGLPAKLVHRAPLSKNKPLQTVLLRDTPLAAGSDFQFDDTCQVTVIDGALDRLAMQLKLTMAGPPRKVTGLHVVMLTGHGMVHLTVGGDRVRAFVGVNVVSRAVVNLAGEATLFVGDGTTMPNARILAANADVVIGDDCQIAEDVVVQASDPHPVIDLETGETLNHMRRHVTLGSHVWVGRRALILPDVTLADGCIVDPGSTVVADVASQTQVGGCPATLRRTGVGWARQYGAKPPRF